MRRLFFLLSVILFLPILVSAQSCSEGSSRDCGITDVGECSYGIQSCSGNEWGICHGAVYPEISELCNNNLDDDCDGSTDEGCVVSQGTCFDKMQNNGELGIDCGGQCPSCGTCFDGVKNQNEVNVDCGGVCPSCPSCSDR